MWDGERGKAKFSRMVNGVIEDDAGDPTADGIVELAAAMDAFQEASPEVWYGDGHKHVLVFHDVYAPSRGYERQGIYFCNCGYSIPEGDWPRMSAAYTIEEM